MRPRRVGVKGYFGHTLEMREKERGGKNARGDANSRAPSTGRRYRLGDQGEFLAAQVIDGYEVELVLGQEGADGPGVLGRGLDGHAAFRVDLLGDRDEIKGQAGALESLFGLDHLIDGLQGKDGGVPAHEE